MMKLMKLCAVIVALSLCSFAQLHVVQVRYSKVADITPSTAAPYSGPALTGFTLSTTTSGASIYYTTDGSTPACPSTGTLYSAPFDISTTTTVNAIGCASGMNDSNLFSGVYTVAGGSGWGSGTISEVGTPVHHYGLAVFNFASVNAHDLLVCGMVSNLAGTTTLSDTNASNTWTHETQFNGNGAWIDVFWTDSVGGASAITITSTASGPDDGGTCVQYRSTVTTTGPVRDASMVTGTSATATTTPSTSNLTTTAGGMIWVYYGNKTNATAATDGTGGYVVINSDSGEVSATAHKLNTTAGTYTPQVTTSNVGSWVIVALGFK